MKKQVNKMLGFVCYIIGVVCSVYFGLWKMLLIPLRMLYVAAVNGELSATLVIACAIIMLQYLMNDTIQTEEDVKKYLGLHTLAAMPMEKGR